jgi:hypothetical protein
MTGEKVLELVIAGAAQQQGSVKAFVPTNKAGDPLRRAGGSIVVNLTSDNARLRKWRKGVAELAAQELYGEARYPMAGVGFTVSEVAYFRRPAGHYGTGRNAHLVKDHAPARPITAPGGMGAGEMAPDVDKLVRAALDALTGVVWKDDVQVTDIIGRKRYAVPDDRGDGVMAVVQVWINEHQRASDLPVDERRRGAFGLPRQPDATDDEQQGTLELVG